MKNMILALFLIANAAFAAPPSPPSVVPSITIGGRVFTDLRNLKVLNGYSYNASANYVSLRLPNASAGYAVTTAKTLRITAGFGYALAASTLGSMCYGDNDVGGSGTTPPTNIVYMSGDANFGQLLNLSATSDADKFWVLNFTVPAGKIPCLKFNAGGGGRVTFFGYEE